MKPTKKNQEAAFFSPLWRPEENKCEKKIYGK